MTFVDDARLRSLLTLAAEPEVVAGRFELGALLGEGGMGRVFEAWDREGDRNVALKLLRDVNEDADVATSARFEREAAALATLDHPGIVGYVAHGCTVTGQRYLAMERLVGETLAARLARGPLGVRDAARVGHDVAEALAAAHGLVHRDIKPSNIFLSEGEAERITLLDFGLARGKHAPTVTRSGALVGTPSYMAPEQVRGTTLPDARGDLFALGAVLFECLTGRAPFVGTDMEGVLVKILVGQPPAVRELCPSVPPPFEALIARLLSKDPGGRPRDAAAVARELAPLLAEQDAEVALAATADANAAARAPNATAAPGTLIAGKYRVVRALGSGGMGIVLLARHEALERNVAIKLLRGSGGQKGSGAEARLVREARAVSRLESEHVARVMDVGVLDDGAPFIVMEFLSGKDLGQVLLERKRLPVAVVVDYVLQAGEALAEAHALGIVHRDLKPSNLFLASRRDGSPLIKVLDFGISKLSAASDMALSGLPSEASITAPDVILGSPLYMSPEQLHSTTRVDARTDIWSLGVVLQQLLTGRPPFEADSFMAIGARIAASAPTELREGCPEAPEGLAAVVRRCLEKDPARRFGSITELAQALGPYAPERSRLSIERITRVAGAARTSLAHEAAPGRATPVRGRYAVARLIRRPGALVIGGAAAVALGAALLAARRAPVLTESAGVSPFSAAAPSSSSTAAPSLDLRTPAASLLAPPSSAALRPDASSLASMSPLPAAGASSSAHTRRAAPAGDRHTPAPTVARSRATAKPRATAKARATAKPPTAQPPTAQPPTAPADPMNPALLSR